ncbi:SIMPL domain-containing protein [Defluviimonas sp. WL0024]|uniref:SIMPL domain-containing protein n=1 Tax=Albidovulum salinarum TaxID=2984153 RepID=A0ABT2X6V0_9RHOB|nr:SIMPL domain-containing protein [Defluviimonas sp. WL0024]MCU9849054.1 SIMPL domain-containing protein [Defluviimonas sp. WL0024]
MRFLSVFVTVLALALPAAADEVTPATISVTGEGRVEAAPDMATVSLGVTSEAATAAEAMAANSEAVAAVIGKLRGAGTEDRDLQTTGLSLGPRYDYDGSGGAPKLAGYVASNMVTVRVRALDTLGGVLDAVVSEGANTLNGLSFGLQDDQAALDEARRLAVADAARKAALYAEAAGVKLGRVVRIGEQGGQMPPMPMGAEAFAKSADVPVAPGELNLSSSVLVVYEIDD